MKLIQILGHNSNWNIESHLEQNIGDEFLIAAFTFGSHYQENKRLLPILSKSMIDMQFYGQKKSADLSKGKLSDFDFHPANFAADDEPTNVVITNCIQKAIAYQEANGFSKIIIPHYYEDNDVEAIISIIKCVNAYLKCNKHDGKEYYMTLPLANDIIRNNEKIDKLLLELTDMHIVFDGYFIACENKPEQGHKLSVDDKLMNNLSKVLRILRAQSFKTIYAYANWDALFYLAQTDIDYITIGTYENLRNFSIKRFVEDISGGASEGYYFSEKLLNVIRAKDLVNIRHNGMLPLIKNDRNVFSNIILDVDYKWNIHKPDVNKNYLLAISRLLKEISEIEDIRDRTLRVLALIKQAQDRYQILNDNYVVLQSEGRNYHLDKWMMYLLRTIQMKPAEFFVWYDANYPNDK